MQNYTTLENISSTISKVLRVKDNKVFVRKTIVYVGLSKTEKKKIVDTINTLIQLRSTNVVRYHNCIVDSDEGTLNLFTDYCEGGSLASLIKKHNESRKPFDEEQIWSIATDIALALYDCHSHKPQPITHGQLNAEHVFIDADGAAKIGCFSLDSCNSSDFEKDVTDLGRLIFEMATLSKPEIGHHSFQHKLRNAGEGIRDVCTKILAPNGQKFTLMNFLEFPEVALKVLEKKLTVETAIYEQEKAKYLQMEDNLNRREKNLGNHAIKI